MNFDYIKDLFGRFRKGKKTKFTELEDRAKLLMASLVSGRTSYDKFYLDFNILIGEFQELCVNVIDEDTPLWFNSFSAYVFLRWRDWHVLRTTFQKYPEKFNSPELLSQYKSIESRNYDGWLKEKIKDCLENL